MAIFDNICAAVGNTPLVRLKNFKEQFNLKADIYAKVEYLNPTCSVKDRAAKKMLEAAFEARQIREGSTIIEATSGNFGIALAALCSVYKLKLIVIMPENASVERRKILHAYGAEVRLTSAAEGIKGAAAYAASLIKKTDGAVCLNQFANPYNVAAHYKGTAPEIYRDLNGKIDIFVAGVGTGGSLVGCAKYLKKKNPKTLVCAVEPSKAAALSGKGGGSHLIEGIGAGFVPDLITPRDYDMVICVTDENAQKTVSSLAVTEGLFVGISSGAAAYAAKKLAKDRRFKNKNIVALFPDGGERYLSKTKKSQFLF